MPTYLISNNGKPIVRGKRQQEKRICKELKISKKRMRKLNKKFRRTPGATYLEFNEEIGKYEGIKNDGNDRKEA